MTATADETIAELIGVLTAFEWINGKTNHSYTFRIETSPSTDDAEAFVRRVTGMQSGDGIRNKTDLADWRSELGRSLEKWLFSYLLDSHGCLTDPHRNFTLTHQTFRTQLVQELIQKLDEIVGTKSALKINLEMKAWYECAYDDFLLLGRNRLCYVHLGVSD